MLVLQRPRFSSLVKSESSFKRQCKRSLIDGATVSLSQTRTEVKCPDGAKDHDDPPATHSTSQRGR